MSLETIKAASHGLRGALPIELAEPAPSVSDDVKQLLKFHGIYQQHDRDVRGRNHRAYSFMVRSKLPGGRLTAHQYLVHDALADTFAGGDLRLTTRQGIQLHGVIKHDLQGTLRGLNAALVSTLGACGDVERNVMACPAPFGDPVREQLQAVASAIAEHLAPRTPAYHEIWLEDETGTKVRQRFDQDDEQAATIEPIYGKTYLPRKFKTAIAYPGDNSTDIFSNDVGLVGLVADDGVTVHGFNVFVGGGMGQTHNASETYPALALPLAYVPARPGDRHGGKDRASPARPRRPNRPQTCSHEVSGPRMGHRRLPHEGRRIPGPCAGAGPPDAAHALRGPSRLASTGGRQLVLGHLCGKRPCAR